MIEKLFRILAGKNEEEEKAASDERVIIEFPLDLQDELFRLHAEVLDAEKMGQRMVARRNCWKFVREHSAKYRELWADTRNVEFSIQVASADKLIILAEIKGTK